MRLALLNCRRYLSLFNAERAAMRQHYWVPVLMGDDDHGALSSAADALERQRIERTPLTPTKTLSQ